MNLLKGVKETKNGKLDVFYKSGDPCVSRDFCVAGPLYQLRLVKLQGKLGYPIIYDLDRVDDAWEKEGEGK